MSQNTTIYLHDYKPAPFHILHTDMTFEIFDTHTLVINKMKIQRIDPEAKELFLDGVDLKLICVKIDEVKSMDIVRQEAKGLYVPCDQDLFILQVATKIYPDENTTLEGLYRSGEILCTQNEPEGFRHITYFIDRPDNMSTFTTTIYAETTRYPLLLSNGNLVETQTYSDGRHMAKWEDPFVKPSYLFALVAGDLGVVSDRFTTMEGNEVALNIYVDRGNESKCGHAMRSLKKSMKWDEEVYGRAYDLEIYNIVAVDSFNMGAMENKGLNIFNSHYVLADEDSATDQNFMGIESVIAHEYFHNWTGNRITCRDWFQLTLKEGLTVFRDQSFSADMNDATVQRISDVKALRERQYVEDAGPTAHPIKPKQYMEINNFYTATVYEKGAEVIRMLYTFLGAKKFRAAMDLYFKTFDAQAVRTEDFLWAMHQQGGFDLERFKLWYDQERTPTLQVEVSYDAEQKSLTLTLTQDIEKSVSGEKQKAHYYPLGYQLLDSKGIEIKASIRSTTSKHPLEQDNMLIMDNAVEIFIFEGLEEEPKLSINTNFSAPIKVDFTQADYLFLMQHDRDGFNRYEAVQQASKAMIEKFLAQDKIDEMYLKAYGTILEDEDLQLQSKAYMLELPSLQVLMQEQTVVDVAALSKALSTLKKSIALHHKEAFITLYQKYHKPQNSALDSVSMGERAVKNRVLSFLMALEDDEIDQYALQQYKESVTMTDRIVALDLLENYRADLGEACLRDFYQRYKEDTLVMNKYLSVLAASEREGTIDRVQALQNDPVYNIKVPNLVRSLIGVFARNAVAFHAQSGHGYSFVADKVIEIDAINPQIASGLVGAFKGYSQLTQRNQRLMQIELQKILAVENISSNVYELVEKILKTNTH